MHPHRVVVLVLAASCSAPTAGGLDASTSSPCDELAAAMCDFSVRCHLIESSATADCIPYFSQRLCGTAAPSLRNGNLTVEAAAKQSCLSFIDGASCDAPTSALLDACEGLGVPTVATGGSCLASHDCREDTDGCAGNVCNRTCQPGGMLGQPCPSRAQCAAGLHCDATTSTCAAPGGAGARCEGTSGCASGLRCDSTTRLCVALPGDGQRCESLPRRCAAGFGCDVVETKCVPLRAEGAPCLSDDVCQPALYCDTSASNSTCRPRLGAGASCTYSGMECAAGLVCLTGVDRCGAPKAAGEPCRTASDCVSGTLCDPVTWRCGPTTFVSPGEPCTTLRLCPLELVCVGRTYASDGGAGTPGSCRLPMIGDACVVVGDLACPAQSFCQLADAGTGTCAASFIGASCSRSTECPEGATCLDKRCTTRKAAGTACQSTAECVTGLVCSKPSAGAAKVCAVRGSAGSACFEESCAFPLLCKGGTCVHAGADGESCLAGNLCLGGACSSTTMSCGPLLAGGATCRADFDCESAACVNGTCEAVCP